MDIKKFLQKDPNMDVYIQTISKNHLISVRENDGEYTEVPTMKKEISKMILVTDFGTFDIIKKIEIETPNLDEYTKMTHHEFVSPYYAIEMMSIDYSEAMLEAVYHWQNELAKYLPFEIVEEIVKYRFR